MNRRTPDAHAHDVAYESRADGDADTPDPGEDAPVADESSASVRQRLRAVVASVAAQAETADPDSVAKRLGHLERQNRWMRFAMVALILLIGFMAFGKLLPTDIIVRQTLLESKELKLLDNDGNPRLFLRMYSRVPVLQLLDSNGKPRMSLGLRFDDTPFLDLSDKTGKTRATLEMTPEDEPMLVLFDKNGDTTFKIK